MVPSQHAADALPRIKPPSINPALLIALVLAIAVIGGALVLRFAQSQQDRELMHWQNKLNLIADSRASDISNWLGRHFKELGEVAGNPSLQLYLAELLNKNTTKNIASEEPAQTVFLRNLLLLTADRLGFIDKSSDELKSINANVRQPSGTGLAILDNSGKIMVSTAGLPSLDPSLAKKIAQVPQGQSSLIDIYATPSGETRIGFVLPVYPIQADPVAAQQIGKLVGVKNVGSDFFALLQHPGVTEKTLEAVLLRKEGDNVVYLSTGKDGKPLSTRLSLTTAKLDAAYAINSPGNFAVKKDSLSHATLMTSRTVGGSPWTLLLHIDRDQALTESDSWRRQMEYVMFFALMAMIGGMIAIWYYGTSKRSTLLLFETRRLATQASAQKKLLQVVTDNQPEPIFIADRDNIVRFANEKAGNAFHMPAEDAVDKEIVALMGLPTAKDYIETNQSALTTHTSLSRTWRKESDAGVRIICSQHVPLAHIPIDRLPFPSPGVLVIDQDVTEIVNERERRMRNLRQLIDTLVYMVDKRDPHAANHSAGVALVAHEVAAAMGLDAVLIETAEIAGNLMNIGKIVVPSALLKKTSALAEDEMKSIRESMLYSILLLEKIEFDGPVVETLRQAQEHFDGTGPLKLKGERILVTARIVAVANAFVGMISPRSYRKPLSIEQATKTLLQNMDTQFDRRVVVALANFVENKHGRETLLGLVSREVAAG